MGPTNGSPQPSVQMQAATAAGALHTLPNGDEIELSPLTMKDVADLSRICLERWRRDQLQTIRDNRDLLGEDYDRLLMETLQRVQNTQVEDLGTKKVVIGGKTTEIPYYLAWMQTPGDGMVATIWKSMVRKHPEMTLADVSELFDTDDVLMLQSAAEKIGELSAPKLGNEKRPRAKAKA